MLLDKFGRPLQDLRISITDKCNFRCTYCMPVEIFGEKYEFLPNANLLTYDEITRIATVFVRLGVSKLRLTGGEPLVRHGVEELVAYLASIPGVDDVTLTTNGFLLADKAQILKNAGLHRVTVSLDTMDNDIFKQMTGRKFGPERVLEGIQAAIAVGLTPVKVNSVVMKGLNDSTIPEMARYFRRPETILRFIEYMDVGNVNGWRLDNVVSGQEIVDSLNTVGPLESIESNYKGEVVSRFRYQDGNGEVGVITSVTQPFCGDCTRMRLSPDGKLYTCLFASENHDLMIPLRSGATDSELQSIITDIWLARDDRYSELRTAKTGPQPRKVEMYQIGG
jgi:cyclic pyranopterin phosphate synthase